MPLRRSFLKPRRKRTIRRRRLRRFYKLYRRPRYMTSKHFFTRWTDANFIWTQGSSQFNADYGIKAAILPVGSAYNMNAQVLNISCVNSATTYLSLSFSPQLRSLPALAEFNNLFDKYRILGWAVHIIPLSNDIQIGGGNLGAPIIHSILDYDDDNLLSADANGVLAMKQYRSYSVKRVTSKWSRFVKPSTALAGVDFTTGSAVVSTTVTKRKQWLDIAYAAIPTFGQKMIIEVNNPTGSTSLVNFKVEIKMYLQMAMPR